MEGERIQKMPSGKKRGLMIAGVSVVVLLCAYLGLCAWVGASDTIMPNVSIAGVDVSGMTAPQAAKTVEQTVQQQGGDIVVTLSDHNWSASLSAQELEQDWDQIAQYAQNQGRENFFLQGGQYLVHLAGRQSVTSLARGGQQPALEGLLDQADQEVGGGVTQAEYQVEGENLVVTKGVTGVAIDRAKITPEVMDAFDEGFMRKFAQGDTGVVEQRVALSVAQTPPDSLDFNAVHSQIYTQAKSAEMDPQTYQITEHVVGIDFDVSAAQAAFVQAGEGERILIPLKVEQPKETRQSLEAKLFSDLLGQATSTVGGSANRKFNVKLSAQACDGIILLPGQEFSYNNTTGSRSADKGYLPAPVYVGGKSEDEVGGGICQTSSTIYYAVLHTSLEVVERKNHMYAVGYVPDGMDATVYYGSTDFRFKNNTDYPVKLVTESYDKGGERKLTVKIYGTNESGGYGVPERTRFDDVTPTTKYVADNTVPRGTTVEDKKQNPYTGRKAQTYRYIYSKDGTLLEKQNMGVSTYKMRPKTIYYNPQDGDPATWPNGVPPKPVTPTDPNKPVTPTDPNKPVDPGTATDPGTTPDPGATTDPSVPVDPNKPTDQNKPVDPNTGNSETTPPAQPGSSAQGNAGTPDAGGNPAASTQTGP